MDPKLLLKLAKHLSKDQGLAKSAGLELHHNDQMSRRDLLSAGLYTSAYSLFLPSTASLLLAAKEAQAQNDIQCILENKSCGVPFAQINFSGGRNLWGHGIMLGMKADGQPGEYRTAEGTKDSDYFGYGASPDLHPRKFDPLELGGHPFLPYHYMYTAAESVFGSEMANISKDMTIISFCARTPDDSGATLQNMMPIVSKMRGKAEFQVASNMSGSKLSGLNSLSAFAGVETNANVVSNPDISKIAETGLPTSASIDLKKNYMNAVYSLLAKRVPDQAVKQFFCSREAAKKKLEAFASEMNPHAMTDDLLATEMVKQFPDENSRLGTIAYMLASGLVLSGGMNFGGYDYHDQTSQGYAKDFNVYSTQVWPLIAYFHAIKKPVLLFLTSDGSTRCTGSVDPQDVTMAGGSTANIPLGANNGDAGRHGGAVLIALNPGKGRIPLGRGQQVGHGTPKGIAGSGSNLIGDYQTGNYQKVVFETIRRLMSMMSPGCEQAGDFQELTEGARFDEKLESYVPKIG